MITLIFVLSVGLTMVRSDIVDFYPKYKANLTEISWDHAVNNKSLLTAALASEVMMIEADISMGQIVGVESAPIPIMSHPPAVKSDLSLEWFLGNVSEYNKINPKKIKGIKLDFKSIEAFEASIGNITKTYNMANFPIWINADILKGPFEPTTVPVDSKRFLAGCKVFPNATLSIGWTTNFNSTTKDKSYTDAQITEMMTVIKDNGISHNITFPVRAGLAINSVNQMKKLLETKNSTLTVWSGKADDINIDKLVELILEIGLNKVYLDVPANVSAKMNLNPSGKNAGNHFASFGALTAVLAITAYIFGGNIF